MTTPINARSYFRRRGILLVVAAVVVGLVGAIAAPDALGLGIAAALALGALAVGLAQLHKARTISPTAIVRETTEQRRGFLFGVHYEIEDPAVPKPPRSPGPYAD